MVIIQETCRKGSESYLNGSESYLNGSESYPILSGICVHEWPQIYYRKLFNRKKATISPQAKYKFREESINTRSCP